MINFSVSEEEHLTRRGLKKGTIVCKNVGPIANSIRRILLDEIPRLALDTNTAILKSNDPSITHDLLRVITLVRVFDIEPDSEFFINTTVQGDEPYKILSNHIMDSKTHKPANVEQNVALCTLNAGCSLKVIGIKTQIGTGRTNAKFSEVVGAVTYKPLDVCFVYYLNERGFIETDLKPVYKVHIENYEEGKKFIFWNPEWAKLMSKSDITYSSKMVKIKPTNKFRFLTTETDNAQDFLITFQSENPELSFTKAKKVLLEEVNKKITFDDFHSINESFTISAGEVIKYFCWQEMECPIMSNWKNDDYKITVQHVDHEKIVQNAIKKINTLLK